MKKSLSPPMIVLIVALGVIVLGLIFFKTASPGKNEALIDQMMKNTPMSGMQQKGAPAVPAK